ncbi:hypothetical protein C4J98_2762 [Pseudomonas orientalis]|nr:hypothetical protein C4J98_2762 [Pseudomonas orientalis]
MATLHLLCGKIASGRSTLASGLATDAEFDLITCHICVPSEEEGLVIEVHRL